jgi:hypothetical protein
MKWNPQTHKLERDRLVDIDPDPKPPANYEA